MGRVRISIAKFLQNAKEQFNDALKEGRRITLVSGNQSADLDSMSSSILYAYFRSHKPPSSAFTKIYVPLLNIPAKDIGLRPEFAQLFKQTDIKPADFVTLDDLPKFESLGSDLPPDKTRWILVDHNKLEGDLGQVYGNRVHGVIDHHVEEHAVPKDTAPEPRIVEKCGSCTSLIVRHFASTWETLDPAPAEDAQLGKLAMASILIDTKNLKDEFKVLPADSQAADICTNWIVAGEDNWNQEKFYEEMSAAKNNIECLPLQGILRKDYKEWTEANIKLGMSSVVKPLEFLVDKAREEKSSCRSGSEAWDSEISTFMKDHKLDLHSVGTTYTQDGEFSRELCLEWTDDKSAEAVRRFEKNAADTLHLKNKLVDGTEGKTRKIWQQNDINASRKTVGPLLREAMRGGGSHL